MLDDLKFIHEHDPHDMLGYSSRQTLGNNQLSTEHLRLPQDVDSVIVAPAGIASVASHLFKGIVEQVIPCTVLDTYMLPGYVQASTLLLLLSTERTDVFAGTLLDQVLHTPVAARPTTVVVAPEGSLIARAVAASLPYIILPEPTGGVVPIIVQLSALLASVKSLLLHQNVPLLPHTWLAEQQQQWLPTVRIAQNQAKQIALELLGRSLVISSAPGLYPAALYWKTVCNVRAKQVAWVSQYPQAAYDELIGWTKQPHDKPYAVVELHSALDTLSEEQFMVASRLLSGRRPNPIAIATEGVTLLEQQLWAMLLGDFVSVYLALLNNVDPADIRIRETFKQAMEAYNERSTSTNL